MSLESTPLVMVADDGTLAEVAHSLEGAPVIGIDTESDSFHHYQEKVCLIQISDLRRDIIIDPLAVRDLSPLGKVLGDPATVKVLHGADYDVVCLRRDFGFRMRNLFDTMISSQFLGFPHIGLADLVHRYFGQEIDKRWQRHDWAARPLLAEHLEYARGDTHWLLALREVLTIRLGQAGRLHHVLEESRALEDREWQGPTRDAAAFLRVRGARDLDEAGLRVLRAVWSYRDEQARAMDRPAFKVMPDTILADLARAKPERLDDVAALMRPGSAMARRHGTKLMEAVRKGLADTEPLPEPRRRGPRSAGAGAAPGTPGIDRLLGPLKDWRNRVVEERGLNPVVVASNQELKSIARTAPDSLEALRAVPGLRSWQVDEYGEEILGVIASVAAPKRRRRRRGRGDAGGDPPASPVT